MKVYDSSGDRTPDPLNQRQTCYHLSQRGALVFTMYIQYYKNFGLLSRDAGLHLWLGDHKDDTIVNFLTSGDVMKNND